MSTFDWSAEQGLPHAAGGLRARLATSWTILRICLEERLVYRGDFALGTLMRFLPIVTQIFLWSAVFTAIANHIAQTGAEQLGPVTINGYTYEDIIAYYLLTMVGRAFSSMPGLSSGISRQIRSGEIKKFLIQPVDLIEFLLLSRVAHKLVYYLVAAIPFGLVFFLCRSYFPGWPEPEVFAAFLLSLVLSFLLGFFLEGALGMIGFWFLEVSSLLFVYMLMQFFFSGHMFPISFLPGMLKTLVNATPFPYLAYFPAAVFLGKIQGQELVVGLAVEVMWVVFFALVCRYSLQQGLKRYSAFGG